METATFNPKTLQPNQVNIGTLQNPNIVTSVPSNIKATNLSNGSTPFVDPTTSNTAGTKLATNIDTTLGTLSQVTSPELTDAPAQQKTSLLDKISETIGMLGNKGERTAELQREQQVNAKKTASTELENTMIAKSRAYDKQIEKIRANAGGLFGGAVEQEINRIERQKNSELADLSIQYKVANGAYVDAVNLVNDAVEAEFEPLKDQISSLTNLYQLYQDDLSESEKVQVQAKIQAEQNNLQFKQQTARDAMLHKYQLSEIAYREGFSSAGGGVDGDDIDAYVTAYQLGQVPLTQIPAKIRGQVLAAAQATGNNRLNGLLAQYRDQLVGLNVLTANKPGNKAMLENLKGQITAEYKQQKQLGTLDAGVQKLIDSIVPNPSRLSISALSNKAQVEALDNFIKNQGGTTVSSAPANTALMVGPDGKEYHVPNDQVESFIKDGGKKK